MALRKKMLWNKNEKIIFQKNREKKKLYDHLFKNIKCIQFENG
jgi:hypothetical protein